MPLGLQVRSRSVSHDSVEQFGERVRSISADSAGQWRQLGIDEPAYAAPSEQEVKHLHKIPEVSKESLFSRDSQLECARSELDKNSYSTEKVSMGLKVCITVVVLIPKMCIAMWLWFIGARWLTSTPGIDNVVLNALALTFICDLDEVIYRTCVSEATKEGLSRTTLPLPPFSHKPTLLGPTETWFTLAACVVWSVLYKDYFQTAIPHYRGDLVIVCRSELHSMVRSRMR